MPRGSYLERVVYLAHGYESPFQPPMLESLPLRVDVEELRRHVEQLAPADCSPCQVGGKRNFVRLDEALGERVYDWCDEHGVPYGSYLRSILRMAAGYRSVDDLPPTAVQDELLDPPMRQRGREERARAS